jgi:hypothetical protein
MKKKLKGISLCLVFAFSLSSTVSFATPGGSIGQGDFSVLKNEQVVDTLKGQNPIDESSLLVCDGKCMIKSEGIWLRLIRQIRHQNDTDTFSSVCGPVSSTLPKSAQDCHPEGVYSVAKLSSTRQRSCRTTAVIKTQD